MHTLSACARVHSLVEDVQLPNLICLRILRIMAAVGCRRSATSNTSEAQQRAASALAPLGARPPAQVKESERD